MMSKSMKNTELPTISSTVDLVGHSYGQITGPGENKAVPPPPVFKPSRGMELIFHNVNLSINKKKILHNVAGIAKPGEMLAVMGPSGSGKTTLLSTIAGRLARETGDVLLNGQPVDKRMRRKICYVLQSDIFFANLTLKETLVYTALLRLPDSMPHKDKMARVDEIVESLDMRKCLNTLIGNVWQRGLSGGEKKRANIACELLTNPTIMLLDEPTSGLDSSTAYSLMTSMKEYTESHNKTVVTTIHQPSSQIFHMFDRLLLLCEGHVAYFGDAHKVVDFFDSIGLPCTPHYNPADFMLEKVKESEEIQNLIIENADARRQTDQWPKELKKLDHKLALTSTPAADSFTKTAEEKVEQNGRPATNGDLVEMKLGNNIRHDSQIIRNDSEISILIPDEMAVKYNKQKDQRWPTSWWTQYQVLTRRNFTQSKARIWSKINLVQSVIIASVVGLLWFQLPRTEDTVSDRLGVIFFTYVYWSFVPMFDAITSFPEERVVINKERSSGAYRLSAYYCAKMTSELPLILVLPTGFTILVFWMAGLNGVVGFFGMWATIMLTSILTQGIGFVIGMTVLDLKLSISTAAIFMLSSMLAGGYYTRNIPFWLDWIKYLSFINYCYHTGVILEFTGAEPFSCLGNHTTAYADCLHDNNLGLNLNGTLYFKSEAVLEQMGITWPLWLYVLVIAVATIIVRLTAYLILRFIRKPH
ncbi:ABC transporter G family member 14 isoform X2 [Lingula anatina]|uniref:ABC transporter G family member 14 isoform X2 n=1 Tax=Lingula anatina TaxID=7574 RepID=A0A1S3JAR8_LINAN|nr:ABC transporter G family member 14 isoform X2 [Lingula anatina]|eukprot:XP_013407500.1 ABC transporter G family member 14 isoform X2 [Lingula anatina]